MSRLEVSSSPLTIIQFGVNAARKKSAAAVIYARGFDSAIQFKRGGDAGAHVTSSRSWNPAQGPNDFAAFTKTSLHAADVLTRARVDLDLFADLNEWRNLNLHAGFERRFLVLVGRGGTLEFGGRVGDG